MTFNAHAMSGPPNSSQNGSASNPSDSSGQSFNASFSGQSAAGPHVFHQTGSIQTIHNMPESLPSRNSTVCNAPSGDVQKPSGDVSSGRLDSKNISVALSLLLDVSYLDHSGMSNKGGPLSKNYVQAVKNLGSMGMMKLENSNYNPPLDINEFPQLTRHRSSTEGPQRKLGSLPKQGFSIQNEDFPPLPGFKGGNADQTMDMHQKEQLHDNKMSMMQPQQSFIGRSAGATYSSQQPQLLQQHAQSVSSSEVSFAPGNNQDLLHTSEPPSRVSGVGSFSQLIPQYQQQNQPQFLLQNIIFGKSFEESALEQMAAATTLRQSLDDLLSAVGSPLSDELAMGDPEFIVPLYYLAEQTRIVL